MAFKGKAPGSGAGEMSKRTEALRPVLLLTPKEATEARNMRRQGLEAADIARLMNKPLDEIEKVLVQMRMPRPETTRGTLNVTLAAHKLIMRERQGDEPLWRTFDRIVDELLRLRGAVTPSAPGKPGRDMGGRRKVDSLGVPLLPGF